MLQHVTHLAVAIILLIGVACLVSVTCTTLAYDDRTLNAADGSCDDAHIVLERDGRAVLLHSPNYRRQSPGVPGAGGDDDDELFAGEIARCSWRIRAAAATAPLDVDDYLLQIT